MKEGEPKEEAEMGEGAREERKQNADAGKEELKAGKQEAGAEAGPTGAGCGCGSGPEESEEQWQERTKNSPRLFIYALIAIIAVVGVIMAIKYFYNPEPPVQTGQIVATLENHPSEEISSKYSYNGYKFVRRGDMWYTEVKTGNTVYEVEFYYGPRELQDVPLEGNFADVYEDEEIHVTFDPREEGNLKYLALAVGHFDTSLIKSFGKKIVPGCTVNETSACAEVPVINCDDEKEKAVFFFKLDDEPKVIAEDNCVTIQGSDWDLIKATERFLMEAYGVI